MTVFRLPDLGEGLQEAEIVTWHVSKGGHVIADQPLLSVETDKAVVEVPAPFSGRIDDILAQEGEIVAIGAPLVEITTGATEDKGAIVGDLESAARGTEELQHAPETAVAARAEGRLASAHGKAAPAVRRLARERHVDLTNVVGTGPDGAILSRDVLAATREKTPDEDMPGVRRAMARAMERSRDSVMHATVTDRVDISAWRPDENPTVRLVKAIDAARVTEPALNASFDGERRQQHDHLALAIAVDTQRGLLAPVLRLAEDNGDLAERIAALKNAAENRSVAPEVLRGATFTLSNFGMLGGEHAALVVTPPQVAILGAGRIHDACLAIDGRPVVRTVLPLSLSFDHRAVTGGEAARFLSAVRSHLELSTHQSKG